MSAENADSDSTRPKHQLERGIATKILVVCPVLSKAPPKKNGLTQRQVASGAAKNVGGAVSSTRNDKARQEEAIGLAKAIELEIVDTLLLNVPRPRPATLIGSGKVDEIKSIVSDENIELVFIDAILSPVQQRNLERAWSCKILDRTGLILEIFGARAQTREGRLQVELAHLQYEKSRLVRSWTHLERQRGGFGFLGGPGETQIEADKRMIQERIAKIERLLAKVRRTRALHRGSRKRVPYPIVALVGYTNAGKSTLFNRLTNSNVDAKDLLFATLDPTLRAAKLAGGRDIILSDTVGFVSDLPHELVAAFRSTLEEVIEADIIVHVRDISHPDSVAQASDVADVLHEIGIVSADENGQNKIIEAWNKADLLNDDNQEIQRNNAARRERIVLLSAISGEGLDDLLDIIERQISVGELIQVVTLGAERGREINWIYEHCDVLDRSDEENGQVVLNVRVPRRRQNEFARKFNAEVS